MVTHQPARFVVHLQPLGAGLDHDVQAGEIDRDDVVGLVDLLRRHLAIGGEDPQVVLVDDDEAVAVARRNESVDGVDQCLRSAAW